MRRLSVRFWLLELSAFCLALLQMAGGVRTDEAKYLLSIPYPHPPLVRSIFAFLKDMPGQEFFWRFVIASAVLQAVWFLVDVGYVLSPLRRNVLVVSWLLSAAVLLQTGSIMLAPLTAVFGLICVWLALRPQPIEQKTAPLLGCLWFLALFGAYQTVLYVPLLLGVFRAAHVPRRKTLFFLALPLFLLAIYTLTNPLALASILHIGTQDGSLSLHFRLSHLLWICVVAGSGVGTLAGIVGILTSGRMDFIATLVFLVGFIFLNGQDYYAILLTPILCGGMMLMLCKRRISGVLFLPLHVLVTALLVVRALPPLQPTAARATMRALSEHGITGLVLIDGSFGHEWQYESKSPIGRFTQTLASSVEASAAAIVCTKKTCEEDLGEEWVRMEGAPTEVWVIHERKP